MVFKKLFLIALIPSTSLFSVQPARPHPHYYQGTGEIMAGGIVLASSIHQLLKSGLPKNIDRRVSLVTAFTAAGAFIFHGNYLLNKNS